MLFRSAGGSHHSVLVEFKDFVAVIEGPQDEIRSLAVIAEVQELVPNKPMQDVVNTHRVVLFTRLREKKNTLNVTEWNAGAIMNKADNGSFNYDIRTFNLRRYYYFKDAWLEYQLVAVTEDLEIIGRTPIYDRNISLVRCLPISGP